MTYMQGYCKCCGCDFTYLMPGSIKYDYSGEDDAYLGTSITFWSHNLCSQCTSWLNKSNAAKLHYAKKVIRDLFQVELERENCLENELRKSWVQDDPRHSNPSHKDALLQWEKGGV